MSFILLYTTRHLAAVEAEGEGWALGRGFGGGVAVARDHNHGILEHGIDRGPREIGLVEGKGRTG